LAGGVAVCAAALGFLPADYLAFEAPRWVVFGAGAVFVLAGFMLLARDHRGSDSSRSFPPTSTTRSGACCLVSAQLRASAWRRGRCAVCFDSVHRPT
jgi:hypothetical protein